MHGNHKRVNRYANNEIYLVLACVYVCDVFYCSVVILFFLRCCSFIYFFHSSQDGATKVFTLDMCSYYSMEGVVETNVLGNLEDTFNPVIRDKMAYFCDSFKRIEVDIESSKVVRNLDLPLVDADGNTYRVELASVSPAKTGENYCYAYALAFHAQGSPRYEDMGLLKIDTCAAEKVLRGESSLMDTPTVVAVWHMEDVYVGEPIFVPNPNGQSEDDGTLLVVTKEGETGATALRFIDAKEFKETARVESPIPLMFEFHGQFFPN